MDDHLGFTNSLRFSTLEMPRSAFSQIGEQARLERLQRPLLLAEEVHPSTLSAEIEGQIRLINAQSGSYETEAPRP